MKIKDIIKIFEKNYNKALAYDFDNPGLNVGSCNDEIFGIVICLDVTNEVIQYAIDNDANFIISHHPIIFNEIKNVNNYFTLGNKIIKLLNHGISVYSMHTNFDVKGKIGMGDIVSGILFKTNEIKRKTYIEKIGKKDGLGNIIYLSKKLSINDMITRIKNKLKINTLRVYTKNTFNTKNISKIAILPGSGKSEVDSVIDCGIDLYITGDLMHNNILDLLDNDISYIDCTHYGLEKVFIEYIYDYLKKKYKNIKILKMYNEYL